MASSQAGIPLCATFPQNVTLTIRAGNVRPRRHRGQPNSGGNGLQALSLLLKRQRKLAKTPITFLKNRAESRGHLSARGAFRAAEKRACSPPSQKPDLAKYDGSQFSPREICGSHGGGR